MDNNLKNVEFIRADPAITLKVSSKLQGTGGREMRIDSLVKGMSVLSN